MADEQKETVEYQSAGRFGSQFFVEPTPPVAVRCGAASDIGTVRSKNEDHFAVIRRTRSRSVLLTNVPAENLPESTDEAYLLVVADGMGGAAGGELASRLVLERVWELSGQASSWVMKFRGMSAQQIQERVAAYTAEMHQTLLDHGIEDPRLEGMGTTWTSAYTIGWDALIAQVGDSRAYHFHAGAIEQITRDQTLAQAFIDSGVAAEDALRVRHILTNSLGASKQPVYAEVSHVPLEDGDRLLLCTDGLSTAATDDDIAELLGRRDLPQATCEALVALALERGGTDNVTAIVADFTTPT